MNQLSIQESIQSLIYSFLNSPTLYLEEKHLHNEFDRIVKLLFPMEERIGKTNKESKVESYPFPLLMNEYTTIHRYKAKPGKEGEFGFQEIYDEIGAPGSLDYVFLDSDWVRNNFIFTCLNKDEKIRKDAREDTQKNRYFSTIEIKYLHMGNFYISYDEQAKEINKKTIERVKNDIRNGLIPDIFKQLNENSPKIHAVYFNSDIPIGKEDAKKLLEEILNDKKIQDKLNSKEMKIWYAQAGISTRFKNEKDFYAICMSQENTKIIWEVSKDMPANYQTLFSAIEGDDIGLALGCLGIKGNRIISQDETDVDLEDFFNFVYVSHTLNIPKKNKMDINSYGTDDKTALFASVEKKNERLVKTLVSHFKSLDPNKGTVNRNFPIIAALNEPLNTGILEVLLKHEKINLNLAGYDGKTFLHHYAELGSNLLLSEIEKKISEGKIDISIVDENGDTPLHIAGKNGNRDLYSFLVEIGADVQFKNNQGEIPRLKEKGTS